MNWALELAVSNNGMVDPVQHPYNPTLALSPTQMLSQASLGEWKNKPLLFEVFCLTTPKLSSCCHPYTFRKMCCTAECYRCGVSA
jgi:hypothetical protein